MQPVQYRGYAQGTAFNPLILSDQSRKILEQNEQFLRGLQAKQKIERDIEVAKLKELQQNIESQRQQLNENFGYESRQRNRYNQSLQENAAREVQDLKRIAALQPDKPTTVAVVNEIADFLVNTSQTASKVIGVVKEARVAQDQQAAQEIQSIGLSDAYIGGKAQEVILLDTANNAIVGKYANYAAFKESGYQLQAGQEIRTIKEGVQAQLAVTQAQQAIKSFPARFDAQTEYQIGDQTLTRQQYQLLSAEEKGQVIKASLDKELLNVREVLSPALLRQIEVQSGTTISSLVGEAYKLESDVLDGQALEASRQQMLANPSPQNIHNYTNFVALHNGGDRGKALAELSRVLSDPTVISDAEFEQFADTTFVDQLGNNSKFRQRNSVTYHDIIKRRGQAELANANAYFNKRKVVEKQIIREFLETYDKDKAWMALLMKHLINS